MTHVWKVGDRAAYGGKRAEVLAVGLPGEWPILIKYRRHDGTWHADTVQADGIRPALVTEYYVFSANGAGWLNFFAGDLATARACYPNRPILAFERDADGRPGPPRWLEEGE